MSNQQEEEVVDIDLNDPGEKNRYTINLYYDTSLYSQLSMYPFNFIHSTCFNSRACDSTKWW